MFSYDAQKVVEEAWQVYREGRFPGTAGEFGKEGSESESVTQAGSKEVRELRRAEDMSPKEAKL
jgi:hypothetical protein